MRQTESADNLQATQTYLRDCGWLGGCVDSDGCVTLTFVQPRKNRPNGKYVPIIQFSNSSQSYIDEVAGKLLKYGVGHYVNWQPQRGLGSKPRGQISIQGFKRVKQAIEVFGDFVLVKHKQVSLLTEFIQSRDSRTTEGGKYPPYGSFEKAIYNHIHNLNN